MRSMATLCLIMLYAFNQNLSLNHHSESKPIKLSGISFSTDTTALPAKKASEKTGASILKTNILPGQTQNNFPVVYTNLMSDLETGSTLADGVATGFDNKFSASVDGEDAVKLWNFYENIALVRGNNTLSIEFRPMPTLTDTLFYRLYLKQQQPYTLKIFSQNLAKMTGIKVWLHDKYLNTKTEINLQDTTLYNFMPDADTNTYRNRFMLVFNRQLTATALPFTKLMSQPDAGITSNANSITAMKADISLYPNPAVSGGRIMIRFNNILKGNYQVFVYNAKGQKLISNKIVHNGSNNIYPLLLNSSCIPGLYTVTVENTDPVNRKESTANPAVHLSFLIVKN